MKIPEIFCGQKNGYSRSITLRNRLIPMGKTQENLEKANMLEEDFIRAKIVGSCQLLRVQNSY